MKRVLFLSLAILWTQLSLAAEIQLYGIIDMGMQYAVVKRDTPESEIDNHFLGLATGVQSGSRVGLRGFESVASGWKVGFTLENGFDPGNGVASQGGLLFGRKSIASLISEQYGQLDFGRQINLASNYFLPLDPFAEGFGQANIGASFGSANTTRYSNMLMWQTPSMDGLKLGAGYSFAAQMSAVYFDNAGCSERSGCSPVNQGYNFQSSNNLRVLTLGAQYAKGPLLLTAAYDRAQGPADIPGGPPPSNPAAWLVGAAYTLNTVKLSAVYGQTRGGGFNGQSAGTGAAAEAGLTSATGAAAIWFANNVSHDAYMLGMTMQLGGRGTLLASWQLMQPTGEYASLGFANQQIFSAGYTYQFTTRTNLYAYISYGQNFAMVQTAQSSVLGVGIQHVF